MPRKLRCQPITRRAPLAPTERSIKLRKRHSKLTQLSVSIERLSKHRESMVYWGNKRPSKWDYVIASGRI